ncbi:phosphinothricin acetyltransferase [Parasporobacterium paucivorans DSM 15970]|uniref:Phosphinothricin acetyltransferase n=2 Tax=Parasporobacterium TaxID=115543 RepID=A0A1M6JZ22_9FIRM|nr:phosphinothricin acetyltransferase [Parasporobacterium paucivorans DSM 15970]
MLIRKAEMKDLKELLEIYNHEIKNGSSTLDLELKTPDEWKEWFYKHNVDNLPLFVAEVDGRVAGYASMSEYGAKEAFKTTVEMSIYIRVEYRNKRVASSLLAFILEEAHKDERTHTVVSVITAGNEASRRLHEKFGFEFCGTIKEVGMKFGKYWDIEIYRMGV